MNLDTPSGEKRHDTRYNASWRAALVIGGKFTYEGRLRDISASGAAILIQSNVNVGISLELHMLLPTMHQGHEQKVIIVHGKTCNSTFDSKHYCFRVGINFDKFLVPTDREYLTSRLESHHRVVAESRYGP
jgi:c-di-GMP-binding flagellar brake protein YcgR